VDTRIQQEKLDQAAGILNEQGMDCWLTLTRALREQDPGQKE
jgi:hypothetical protein